MIVSLSETVYFDIATSDATGAAADADDTPTAEVFEDATDTTVYALTVTKRTGKTGNYRIPLVCTTANGFEAWKSYNLIASATVGGVPGKKVVASFRLLGLGFRNAWDDYLTYGGIRAYGAADPPFDLVSSADFTAGGSSASAASIWAHTDRSLTSGLVNVVRPWQVGALNVIKGDSYLVADSTQLVVTKDSTATWPSNLLSAGDYTITFTATPTAKTEADTANAAVGITSTGAVVSATVVNLGSITAVTTATMTAGTNAYTYVVTAKRSSNTIVHTLEAGSLTVGVP